LSLRNRTLNVTGKGVGKVSENDVAVLSKKLDAVQLELSNLGKEVAALTSTVELLVEGKINIGADKVAIKSLDVVKAIALAVIGAISGYFAGRGGQ
jgi:hypothetical protein